MLNALIAAAVRVLTCHDEGTAPDPADIKSLRDALGSTSPELPINVLAAYVLQRDALRRMGHASGL